MPSASAAAAAAAAAAGAAGAGHGPPPLPVGAIVVLEAEEPLVPQGATAAVDVRGARAQLLEYRAAEGRWLVLTLDGRRVLVPASKLRLASASELEELGVDAVLGPASRLPELAEHLASVLARQGRAVAALPLAPARRGALHEAAALLDEDGLLRRLPAPFEPGYLGRRPSAATGGAKVAPLGAVASVAGAGGAGAGEVDEEVMLTDLCQLLGPHLEESLGFGVSSRTDLLLRVPFSSAEDEARYPAPSPSASDVDGFLALMGRKRLCALLDCSAPAPGASASGAGAGAGGGARVRLWPRAPELPEVSLTLVPNSLVLFLTDWYDFEYEPGAGGAGGAGALAAQSFFLERPLEFALRLPEGGLELTPEDLPPARGPSLPAGEPICVAGMASRDPCGVDDHEKLWTAVRHAGCDGFLEIPYTRFDVDAYINYEDQAAAVASGKSYCRHQGHCEDLELFDAAFFNVPQQEAFGMDPEQRIVLETGWLAMSEAGFQRKAVQKESAHLGVFVGISSSDWRDVCQVPSANGVPETFIANRFNYIINLKGPSFIANTACSASLVAMHSAKVHLLFPTDPLDGAVVLGVSLNNSPQTWIGNCAGNMLSFVGRSFSFNSSADGYGRGEGCAAAVVRRCDYDPTDPSTQALLAGTHTNSDGRSASLTAPNGPAQQRLLRAILSETELEPAEVCIYEAHGTGTSLGDPIEIGAVRKVLTNRPHPLMISCSKTNLGHLEGGAGMSSFCKCVMACMHAECAPNQHLASLNPHLDIEGWPAQLLTEGQTLRGDTSYVGVSGFGYGGTNAHSMAYARNVVTSRGGANPRHLERQLFRKLQVAAVAPEVSMEGESYEEWATSGVPHFAREPGASYTVEVLEDGRAVWREASAKQGLDEGAEFQVQGPFSGWQPTSLEASGSEPGLWWTEIALGPSGEELFQVVADYDPHLAFCPEQPRCRRMAAPMLGPGPPPSREHAWLVKGEPGSRQRVEFFFRAPAVAAVFWRPCAEASDGAGAGGALASIDDYVEELE